MGIIIYHYTPNLGSRCVLLVCKMLEIDVDVRFLHLFKDEQLESDMVKINPQHCILTLVDGELIMWESHAILSYLVSSYGKNDFLYSNNLKERAVIDQRLQYDLGILYPRIRAVCFPIISLRETVFDKDKKALLEEAIGFLDMFLDGHDFVAGHSLTIADISIMVSLSNIVATGWDISAHKNVSAWVSRCAFTIPGYDEIIKTGAEVFGKSIRSKLALNQIK